MKNRQLLLPVFFIKNLVDNQQIQATYEINKIN
jgi:hypothetical protein